MTREEIKIAALRDREIKIAASNYVEENSVNGYEAISSHIDSFIEGADWADKHPINVWHDASEEPLLEDKEIIFLNEQNIAYISVRFRGTFLYMFEDFYWERYVNLLKISKWAYIDDLLPKQFRNTKQLKGEYYANNT